MGLTPASQPYLPGCCGQVWVHRAALQCATTLGEHACSSHNEEQEMGKAAKHRSAHAFSHLHYISHCQACSGWWWW